MSLVTSLFTSKPKPQEQVDSSTRGSDMFGSLQNTTQGGTPIALVYGQTRVAGQFISGYLDTTVRFIHVTAYDLLLICYACFYFFMILPSSIR